MPAPVRPSSTPSMAMSAIAAARTTLGSGVTSSTKPISAATPPADPRPSRASDSRHRTEGEAHHDRAVCSRHRGEVRERGFLHRRVELRRHGRRVPHGETGDQTGTGCGKAGGRADQSAAQIGGDGQGTLVARAARAAPAKH